ncbi:MAG: hypothetical protein AAFO69_00660, partial [Bacteroidota bacterium]
MFFKLLKQHLFLYTALSANTLNLEYLKEINYYQYTKKSVEIKNFTLGENEKFPIVLAYIVEGKVSIQFTVADNRFLLKT